MGILFKDTIFVKNDCDLEKEIKELEFLSDKTTDKNAIDKQIKFLKAGLAGEKTIEFELNNARIGMFVLHDVNIQYEDEKAQIDYVIITSCCCYLVECKNMIGDITVDSNGQFIRKLPWGQKESIYSPITQAKRHVDILKKCRDQQRNAVINFLRNFTEDNYYRPLVVVANSSSVLNIKYDKKCDKDLIVRSDKLIDYIQKDIDSTKLIDRFSKLEMEKISEFIMSLNINKERSNWIDKFDIKVDDSDEVLREKLIEYRRIESSNRNYPAYYIFTNKELDSIIEKKPKTIDELKEILEPIKVKIYGESIVKLINNYE